MLRFDGRRWTDYAVADLAVRKAGAAAVALTPGATPAEVAQAVSDPLVAGVLCPPDLVPPGLTAWAASPGLVGEGEDDGAMPGPPAPAPPGLAIDGPLVHGWAPGSPAGQLALGHAARGNPVTALAVFDPDRLGATIARRRVVACGLSPALAAALVAAGAHRRHDLSSVAHVLVSGPPSRRAAGRPGHGLSRRGRRPGGGPGHRRPRRRPAGGVPGGDGLARAVRAGQLQPPVPRPALPGPARCRRPGVGVRGDGPPPRAAAEHVRGRRRRGPTGGRPASERRARRGRPRAP